MRKCKNLTNINNLSANYHVQPSKLRKKAFCFTAKTLIPLFNLTGTFSYTTSSYTKKKEL